MRRLLQFAAAMMLMGAFIPLLELFDRWDAPGLSNDTEFAVFALILVICLVLLVCKLVSSGALKLGFISCQVFRHHGAKLIEAGYASILAVPPQLVPPLRI